jgi:hypothetical protein
VRKMKVRAKREKGYLVVQVRVIGQWPSLGTTIRIGHL